MIEGLMVRPGAAVGPRIILIGDSKTVREQLQKYESMADQRRKFRVTGVLLPAGVKLHFPPSGAAYKDETESNYIWRWIGTEAPDLVLVDTFDDGGLVDALNASPGLIGRIPARHGGLASVKGVTAKSAAGVEVERRVDRTPREVAERLAGIYGLAMPEASYIPAMAMIGRLRLGQVAEVEKAVSAFDKVPARETEIGAHLLFAELAQRTGADRYNRLVERAAEVATLDNLDNEMSDSVFMSCPLLARAGAFDAAVRHLAKMQKLCVREDGLYRHSPNADVAWARGNGFPALGLALMLSALPPDHRAYEESVRAFQNHMAALARYQDESGMWRQVVDRPGSYSELSATAMIGAAMLRGVRQGWLDERAYGPRIRRAWIAVSARTSDDGVLIDVCESTGKQKSAEDYLKRAAITGRDERGGAMVLYFATEMAGLP